MSLYDPFVSIPRCYSYRHKLLGPLFSVSAGEPNCDSHKCVVSSLRIDPSLQPLQLIHKEKNTGYHQVCARASIFVRGGFNGVSDWMGWATWLHAPLSGSSPRWQIVASNCGTEKDPPSFSYLVSINQGGGGVWSHMTFTVTCNHIESSPSYNCLCVHIIGYVLYSPPPFWKD